MYNSNKRMSQLALTTLSGVGLFSTLGFVRSAYNFITATSYNDDKKAYDAIFSLIYLPVYGVVGGVTGLVYGLYVRSRRI